jgi:hypothetical protein
MLLSSSNIVSLNKVFSGGNNEVSKNELLLKCYTYIHTLPSWSSHDPLKGHTVDEEIISPFFILGNKVTGTGT